MWGERKYIRTKPKKVPILNKSRYYRLINRPRSFVFFSSRKTRRLLYNLRPKQLAPKWNFIDMPQYLKEYFEAHMAISTQAIPVITTDMPLDNHFKEMEQSYLAYIKDNPKDRALSPIERATAYKLACLSKGPDGIIRFENGHEISVPYPTPEDGKALGTLNFTYEDTTDE